MVELVGGLAQSIPNESAQSTTINPNNPSECPVNFSKLLKMNRKISIVTRAIVSVENVDSR